jgi:hypothetical protein
MKSDAACSEEPPSNFPGSGVLCFATVFHQLNVTDRSLLIAILLLAAVLSGCASNRSDTARVTLATGQIQPSLSAIGLNEATPRKDVDGAVAPPLGWTPQPSKSSAKHAHQIWLSPTEKTAYGVIRFTMPLPLGNETALWGFMKEMKRTEGEARLLTKQRDPQLKALRFVAEGGLYTVRANLTTRGTRGWAVYAGTKRGQEIVPAELELAERAREHTTPGASR